MARRTTIVSQTLHIIHVEGDIGVGKSALVSTVLTNLTSDWFLTHGQRVFRQGPLGGLRSMVESLLGADLETLLDDHSPTTLARMCAERDAHRALENAAQYAMQDTIGMARTVLAITSLSSRDPDLIHERYSALCGAPIPAFSWRRRAIQGIRVRTSAILGVPEPYETLLGFLKDALLGLHLADVALSAAAQGEPELAGSLIEQGLEFTQEQGARSQQGLLTRAHATILRIRSNRSRNGNARLLSSSPRDTQIRGLPAGSLAALGVLLAGADVSQS